MIMIAIVTIEPTSEFLTNGCTGPLRGSPANAQKHIGSLTHAWDERLFIRCQRLIGANFSVFYVKIG